MSKTVQKVIKITHFDALRIPFVDLEQAFIRISKIMQNYAKMQLESPQNEHEKTCPPVLQWPKTHAVARPAKMHQNAFIFVVPGVALLTPWMPKSLKMSKIHYKVTTKNTKPGVAMIKDTCR